MRLKVSNWSWRETGLAFFVGVFLVAGLWAGARDRQGASPAPTDALVARGHAIFQRERCIFCHTLDGTKTPAAFELTRGGPDLSARGRRRTKKWYMAYLIDPQAFVAGSTMPSSTALSQSDLLALIAFVQSLGLAPMPASGPVEAIPPIAENRETYQVGQRLYETHCADCHGEFGNSIGLMRDLPGPEPLDFTNKTWMTNLSDEYLFEVIANGLPDVDMPGFREELSPTERALILRYLRFFADPTAKKMR